MGKSRKDYEKFLNSISPDRDDEAWIIGGKNRVRLNEDFHTVRLFNTVSVYGLIFGSIKQNNFIMLENDIMQIKAGGITYI